MIDFIPLVLYSILYYSFLMFLSIFVFLGISEDISSRKNLNGKDIFGKIVFVIVLFYMGLRPISFFFGDMGVYNQTFNDYLNGGEPNYSKDVLFDFFIYQMSKIGSATLFFFLCAFLYVYPVYIFSKKMFKDYWFYSFFMIIASFAFWAYGTNGIRNGIATSLFLYAFATDKVNLKYIVFIVSLFIHQSLLLPIFAFGLTAIYKNPKVYFYSWLATIPLSLVLGGVFKAFFLSLGVVDDDDLSAYLGDFDQVSADVVLRVGFRWDFIIYSATGVFAGWYFIIKNNFTDKTYIRLFNIYLVLNGFWILIITANFSNRFAYLSWFMLGPIIIYPLLKQRFFNNQHKVVGLVVVFYTFFTFLLNVILA